MRGVYGWVPGPNFRDSGGGVGAAAAAAGEELGGAGTTEVGQG